MEAQIILKYPFAFLVGFLFVYLLTPMEQRLATGINMVDIPDARRIHKRPTPRGGGIAVFLGFHAACASVFLIPWATFDGDLTAEWWWHFLVASTLLLGLGIADDISKIRPSVKLSGQVLVAVVAYIFDMRVGKVLGIHLPAAVDLGATVLWFVAIINAFNLIDGIDGLASGLASIAALGLAGSFMFRHQPGDALILFGLVGTCLAFLRYNFQPASIFLGDSGSMFLGFVLAAVALNTGAKGTAVATIVVPLLALGVPILDTALAIWRRATRRVLGMTKLDGSQTSNARIFQADMDHVHHRLIRSGLSQRAATTWLYVLGIALAGTGLLSMILPFACRWDLPHWVRRRYVRYCEAPCQG